MSIRHKERFFANAQNDNLNGSLNDSLTIV